MVYNCFGWATVAVAGLITLAGVSVGSADEQAPNLLDNGSFEKGIRENGDPIGWLSGSAPAGAGKVELSQTNPKEGQNCLRITGAPQWAAAISDKLPIDKSKTYLLTGFTRVDK